MKGGRPAQERRENMTKGISRESRDFIRDSIDEDIRRGAVASVTTRFPPEPNGYLHIGHAKSVCLNFGIAAQYGGTCTVRMDDTDPTGESMEFVESILKDIAWLGFDRNLPRRIDRRGYLRAAS